MPSAIDKMLNFSETEMKLLGTYGSVSYFPKNSLVVTEGAVSDDFYLILRGRVRVFVSDEQGKQLTLNIQEAGEFFGEIAVLDGQHRSASVITLEPTQLCVVSKNGFDRCVQENPQLLTKFLFTAQQRIRALTENVKNLALLDVCGRVTATLQSLATKREGQWVVKRLSQQSLAHRVGASREMVGVIIRGLLADGFIAYDSGKKIVIRKKLPRSMGQLSEPLEQSKSM